jgi:hypothetical protein
VGLEEVGGMYVYTTSNQCETLPVATLDGTQAAAALGAPHLQARPDTAITVQLNLSGIEVSDEDDSAGFRDNATAVTAGS